MNTPHCWTFRFSEVRWGFFPLLPPICTVHPVTIKVFTTNWCTRELFLRSIKIYIKITTAAACFIAITIARERTCELAKVTFGKNTSLWLIWRCGCICYQGLAGVCLLHCLEPDGNINFDVLSLSTLWKKIEIAGSPVPVATVSYQKFIFF